MKPHHNFLALLTVTLLFACSTNLLAAKPEIDRSLRENRHPNESASILIELLPDGPPTPFASRVIISNESGRENRGNIHRILRAGNASYSRDVSDGVISAKLPIAAIAALENNQNIANIRELVGSQTFGTTTTARRISGILPATGTVPILNDGALQTVVVIDMGFDPSNPAIAPRVIEERCYSPSSRFCRGNLQRSSGPGTSRPREEGPVNSSYHGTSVAAAIASQAVTLSDDNGVPTQVEVGAAPMVNLVLISAQKRWPTAGDSSTIDDDGVYEALDWIRDQYDAGRRDIKVVNLSFGRDRIGGVECASMAGYGTYVNKFQALKDRNIAVVAASGNTANLPVALPACVPNAISVAQSYNTTAFQTEVNSSSVDGYLKIVAPGGPIDIPGSVISTPGQTTPTARLRLNTGGGTSIAAPMVSSCISIIAKQLQTPLPIDSLITALSMSPATASTPQRGFPLLSCYESYNSLTSGSNLVGLNRYGLTGTFFDKATPGQGFVWEITQSYGPGQGGNFFGAWFTYAPTANPFQWRGQRWYTIQSEALVDFSTLPHNLAHPVEVYDIGPGQFLAPQDPASTVTPVAKACIRFKSCLKAELTYLWNAPSGYNACTNQPALPLNSPPRDIRRINLDRDHSYGCAENTKGGAQDGGGLELGMHGVPRGVSGSWIRYGPPTSYERQGWLLDINPDQPLNTYGAFGAWFTYPTASDPSPSGERKRWFSLQGARNPIPGNAAVVEFDIYFTRGGVFNMGSPSPGTIPVGVATFNFSTCTQAMFSYSFLSNPQIGPELPGISGTSGNFEVRKITPANPSNCQVTKMNYRATAVFIAMLGYGTPSLSQGLVEQIVATDVVPHFNGTRDFFVIVDFVNLGCVWPTGHLDEMQASYSVGKLRLTLTAPPLVGSCPFEPSDLPTRYIIPVSRLLAVNTTLTERLEIETRLVSADGRVKSSTFVTDATVRSTEPVPLESGRWYGTNENPLIVDRIGATVTLSWSHENLSDDSNPAYQWVPPGFAQDWAVRGLQFGSFLKARVDELSPDVGGDTVMRNGIGRFPLVATAGEVHAAFSSPSHMFVSLPNGMQHEARRMPTQLDRHVAFRSPWTGSFRPMTSFEGSWVWHGSRDSVLRGELLRFGKVENRSDQFVAVWRFRFDGGAGYLRCTFAECAVFSTSQNSSVESPVERFSAEGVAEERVFVADAGGKWSPIAFRVE